MTLRDLIKAALRKINVLQPGEEPTQAQMEAAMPVVREIIEEWSNNRLMIHKVKPYYFPVQAGKDTYTLGPGGDWDLPRPMSLLKAKWLYEEGSPPPPPPPPNGLAVALTASGVNVMLRSAEIQMTDFTDFTPFNQALSTTPFDWDTDNLPTGTSVTADQLLVTNETFTIRSASFFGVPGDINPIVYAEITWATLLNENGDVWIGVCTNGTTAAIDPAPEVLTFNPNAVGGGQYFALYNPATGELRNSVGDSITIATATAGDVLGFRFDNYGPGTPVLNPDLEVFINGNLEGSITVPHTCYDEAVGRGQIALCLTRGALV